MTTRRVRAEKSGRSKKASAARRQPDAGRGLYKMRTVTRVTGFSPALLRAWESRFGFVVPQRAPKGHRLFTEEDLLVLGRVKTLLAEGRAIGEVALAGREGLLEQAKREPRGARAAPDSGAAHERAPARQPVGPVVDELRAPLTQLREQVVLAAVALDEAAAIAAIDAAFSLVSPELALSEFVAPALKEIGALWAAAKCSVAGEHLVSGLVQERLRNLLAAGRSRAKGPVTICACLPDELHELGSLVLAYRLSRVGQRTIVLGANLPIEDLEKACEQLRPAAVCLSVTRESLLQTHLPALVALVKRRSGQCSFHVGGEGARGHFASLEGAGVALWPPGRSFEELAASIAGAAGESKPRRRPSG